LSLAASTDFFLEKYLITWQAAINFTSGFTTVELGLEKRVRIV